MNFMHGELSKQIKEKHVGNSDAQNLSIGVETGAYPHLVEWVQITPLTLKNMQLCNKVLGNLNLCVYGTPLSLEKRSLWGSNYVPTTLSAVIGISCVYSSIHTNAYSILFTL